LQTILNICHYFGVNLDALVNLDMSREGVENIDITGQKLRILPVTVDKESQNELSTIVPVKAAAGYLNGYGDIDYIESLPKFEMPFPELRGERTYRLFQVKGDSMLPVSPGAYIICEYVQDWNNIKNEECYVLITKDEGIVYKRVINNLKDGELILKSDNPEYTPYAVKSYQIIEVWKARGFTSFTLPDNEGQQVNISHLTEIVLQLKNEIDELKKKVGKGNE
ncbi:helix-turn-helix transcriptional regulator, partial [Bacteroidota bacterium]